MVTTGEVKAGDVFSNENIWVKRPGTGEIKARDFERVLGHRAARRIPANAQAGWKDVTW